VNTFRASPTRSGVSGPLTSVSLEEGREPTASHPDGPDPVHQSCPLIDLMRSAQWHIRRCWDCSANATDRRHGALLDLGRGSHDLERVRRLRMMTSFPRTGPERNSTPSINARMKNRPSPPTSRSSRGAERSGGGIDDGSKGLP
jgi:hypothetical protein